ncbi:MAG: hypothetical protein LAO21_00335 [Acidobacteriia bacterium]|nr:hypothetical protein [Terriglobia bacterium]
MSNTLFRYFRSGGSEKRIWLRLFNEKKESSGKGSDSSLDYRVGGGDLRGKALGLLRRLWLFGLATD